MDSYIVIDLTGTARSIGRDTFLLHCRYGEPIRVEACDSSTEEGNLRIAELKEGMKVTVSAKPSHLIGDYLRAPLRIAEEGATVTMPSAGAVPSTDTAGGDPGTRVYYVRNPVWDDD